MHKIFTMVRKYNVVLKNKKQYVGTKDCLSHYTTQEEETSD